MLFGGAKYRAKRMGLPFDLDIEWVAKKLESGVCEMTGIPFVRESSSEYKTHPLTPSLDRIIPSVGYTKDNVRIVCFAVNLARSDWGDEVLFKVAHALVQAGAA